jgi:hypothetical protein
MNLHDVNMLDASVHDGSRWLGCLLCPSFKDDSGEQASFNLLTREKVRFWKLQTTQDKNISLSRKSMEGIPIPTSVPAVPTEWNHVKKELRLWAFNGGCQIGSYSDKSKPDFMKKVLQCTRCLSYRPTRPHKFDQNGLREGTKLKEIRQKKKRHAKQKRGIRPAHVRVGKEGSGLCKTENSKVFRKTR